MAHLTEGARPAANAAGRDASAVGHVAKTASADNAARPVAGGAAGSVPNGGVPEPATTASSLLIPGSGPTVRVCQPARIVCPNTAAKLELAALAETLCYTCCWRRRLGWLWHHVQRSMSHVQVAQAELTVAIKGLWLLLRAGLENK